MKLSIEIDNEKIKGLLCCGFEGGINYWAQIDDYEIVKGSTYEDFRKDGKYQTKDYWHPCQIIPLVEGCAVIIRDIEADKLHKLDLKAIHKGMEVMQSKYPKHFADFISNDYDANTGDLFIQCCIFGKIIYG